DPPRNSRWRLSRRSRRPLRLRRPLRFPSPWPRPPPRAGRRPSRPPPATTVSNWPAPTSISATSTPRVACCRKSPTTATPPHAARLCSCCATWPDPGGGVRMRYALGVEYDGSGLSGWQRLGKPGTEAPPTVQQMLEEALSSVADAPVDTVCAGRTDAGVHARCQVVHFDSDAAREPRGWMLGATSRLPQAVCVRWCVPVAGDFSARFSAHARRYRYSILNRPMRPALGRQ